MKMKKIKLSLVVSVTSIAIAFCTYAFSARRTNQMNKTPITSTPDKSNAKLEMEPPPSTVKKDDLTPHRKKINGQDNAEVKTGENADKTVAAFVQAFEQAIVRAIESYIIDALKSAIEAGDDVEIQEVVNTLIGCPGCLEELTAVVRDQSYDKEFRQYAAAALIKSGKAFPAVVEETVGPEQNEFREGLVKLLADLDSVSVAEVPAASLADGSSDEMPNDVRYVIEKAMGNTSDRKAVGGAVTEQHLSEARTETAKERLMSIAHPVMISNVAAGARVNPEEGRK